MRVSAIFVAHVWKNMNVFAASMCMAVYGEQTTVNVTLTMSLPLRYSMPIGVSVRTNASNFISYLFTHTHAPNMLGPTYRFNSVSSVYYGPGAIYLTTNDVCFTNKHTCHHLQFIPYSFTRHNTHTHISLVVSRTRIVFGVFGARTVSILFLARTEIR